MVITATLPIFTVTKPEASTIIAKTPTRRKLLGKSIMIANTYRLKSAFLSLKSGSIRVVHKKKEQFIGIRIKKPKLTGNFNSGSTIWQPKQWYKNKNSNIGKEEFIHKSGSTLGFSRMLQVLSSDKKGINGIFNHCWND